MGIRGYWLGITLAGWTLLLCGCGEQPSGPAAAEPAYLLGESRGKAQARAWRLKWLPDRGEPRADWVITGRHMQATLTVGREEGKWSLQNAAGKVVQEVGFAWDSPLQNGEELLFLRGQGLFGVARDQRIVQSVALPEDAWDDDFWRLPAGSAFHPEGQKLGPVLFADDFAHAEGEFGAWQAQGNWSIETMRNPLRSANAFRLVGTRPPASLAAGPWFWRNYRFGISALCPPGGGFSLQAHRSAADTAYELAVVRDDSETQVRLLRRCHGVAEELGRCVRPPLTGWNRYALTVHEDLVEASLNGHILMQCIDPAPLAAGGIGLKVDTVETVGIEFDDAEVVPAEDVRLPAGLAPTARLVRHGDGRQTLLSPSLHDSCTGLDLPSVPVAELRGVQLLSRLEPGGAGLVLAVEEAGAGGLCAVLGRLGPEGTPSPLAEGPLPAGVRVDRLELYARGNEAWAVLDGRPLCAADTAGGMAAGRSAFVLPPALGREGVLLHVGPDPGPPSLHALNHSFAGEISMENWSAEAAEWQESEPGRDGVSTWIHRSDFWADFTIRLPLGNEGGIREFILCRDTDLPAAGFLSLTVADGKLVLAGEGAAGRVTGPVPEGRIECEKRLDRLLVRADGRVVWTGQAPAGSFWRLALRADQPVRNWLPLVSAGATCLKDDTFTQAPVDWLPASGRWAVTNRWQCDPRWSFYTGRNLAGIAANWFRHRHGENVTLEFFAAPRMNRESGDNYDYARDLNATLDAAGGSLESGYSFLFGGKGNTGSHILHGERTLHANPAMRIPEDKALVHRHWFHLKIRKHGRHLVWWVDGMKVGETEVVGESTGGGRLAIWTQRNQIAVARVRVSSDSLAQVTESDPGSRLAVRSAAGEEADKQEKRQ